MRVAFPDRLFIESAVMKFFPLLLAVVSVTFISCERHSFEETKVLHQSHGAHAEHGAHDDHGHGAEENGHGEHEAKPEAEKAHH
ncbi:MAG: hypothetical protein QM680_09915 [Luteolibacter sp.]